MVFYEFNTQFDKFVHWIKNSTKTFQWNCSKCIVNINCAVTNCLHVFVWSSLNIWIINKHYTKHEAHISIWIHLLNIQRIIILWFQIRKCFSLYFLGTHIVIQIHNWRQTFTQYLIKLCRTPQTDWIFFGECFVAFPNQRHRFIDWISIYSFG